MNLQVIRYFTFLFRYNELNRRAPSLNSQLLLNLDDIKDDIQYDIQDDIQDDIPDR